MRKKRSKYFQFFTFCNYRQGREKKYDGVCKCSLSVCAQCVRATVGKRLLLSESSSPLSNSQLSVAKGVSNSQLSCGVKRDYGTNWLFESVILCYIV